MAGTYKRRFPELCVVSRDVEALLLVAPLINKTV